MRCPLISTLSVILFFSISLFGQDSHLEAGFNALVAEDFLTARKHFARASEKEASAADAYLGLSLAAGGRMDREKAEENYLKYLELEKDPARRNALLEGFWDNREKLLSAKKIAQLERVAKNDYSRVRVMALSALGSHYDLLGAFERADTYYQRIGCIPSYSVVGPFENISESGFDRDFGVLEGAKPTASFTNKRGGTVRWFPGQVDRENILSFGNHFLTGNAVMYAQSFVTSPEEREVFLRLGAGGSARVWVNDALVFSEREERNTNYDAYVFRASLAEGVNRILVQIGRTDKTSGKFALRITGAAGRALEDLSYDHAYANYPQGKTGALTREPNPTEVYLKAQLADGMAEYVHYLALLQLYSLDDRHFERRALYLKALEDFPDQMEFLLALSLTLDELDDEVGASQLRQKARLLDSLSITSIKYRMDRAQEDKDWSAYATNLETLREKVDNERFLVERELILAGARQDINAIVRIIEDGYEKWPTNAEFAQGKASLLREYHQQPDSALTFLENYNRDYFNFGVINALIGEYDKKGDTDRVLELYERIMRQTPDGPGYHRRIAGVYEKRKEYDKADEVYARILEIAPYISSYHEARGDLAVKQGKKKLAAKYYEDAIALNPYDYDSRNALRDLEGEGGTAFSVFPELDYYAIAAGAKGKENYPNDHSAVLRYDVQQVVHPGGATETRTVLLVKVFNNNGVDAWKTYNIPVGNGANGFAEKAEVIAPDGSRNDASRSGSEVVFDGLKPGGHILLIYRTQNRMSGRLTGKFWGEHPITFSYPSDQMTYQLLVPQGMKFDYAVTGLEDVETEPERSELDGRDLYVWRTIDHPGENAPRASAPVGTI